LTPIRRQYLRIKQRYPNAILFFRLGDFYETFDEDAKVASRELDIVLTSRSMGKGTKVPMAGVPAHAVESYLARLIKKGHRVAICEQLSDPTTSKGLVDRDVVRVVTPGTVVEPSMLEQGANNYLAALVVDGLIIFGAKTPIQGTILQKPYLFQLTFKETLTYNPMSLEMGRIWQVAAINPVVCCGEPLGGMGILLGGNTWK